MSLDSVMIGDLVWARTLFGEDFIIAAFNSSQMEEKSHILFTLLICAFILLFKTPTTKIAVSPMV